MEILQIFRKYSLSSSTTFVFLVVGVSGILKILVKRYLELNFVTMPFILFFEVVAEVTICIWYFSIVSELNDSFSDENKFNMFVFYICLALRIISPFIRTVVFNNLVWFRFISFDSAYNSPLWSWFELISGLAAIYSIYFTGRVLIRFDGVQDHRVVRIVISYLELWLYPIGILFLQPKLRDIYQKRTTGAA